LAFERLLLNELTSGHKPRIDLFVEVPIDLQRFIDTNRGHGDSATLVSGDGLPGGSGSDRSVENEQCENERECCSTLHRGQPLQALSEMKRGTWLRERKMTG
jgi:hypothetical protein